MTAASTKCALVRRYLLYRAAVSSRMGSWGVRLAGEETKDRATGRLLYYPYARHAELKGACMYVPMTSVPFLLWLVLSCTAQRACSLRPPRNPVSRRPES